MHWLVSVAFAAGVMIGTMLLGSLVCLGVLALIIGAALLVRWSHRNLRRLGMLS